MYATFFYKPCGLQLCNQAIVLTAVSGLTGDAGGFLSGSVALGRVGGLWSVDGGERPALAVCVQVVLGPLL